MRAVVFTPDHDGVVWFNALNDSIATLCRMTGATGAVVCCNDQGGTHVALQIAGRKWFVVGACTINGVRNPTCRELDAEKNPQDALWIARDREALARYGREWNLVDYFPNIHPASRYGEICDQFPS